MQTRVNAVIADLWNRSLPELWSLSQYHFRHWLISLGPVSRIAPGRQCDGYHRHSSDCLSVDFRGLAGDTIPVVGFGNPLPGFDPVHVAP